ATTSAMRSWMSNNYGLGMKYLNYLFIVLLFSPLAAAHAQAISVTPGSGTSSTVNLSFDTGQGYILHLYQDDYAASTGLPADHFYGDIAINNFSQLGANGIAAGVFKFI